MLFLITFLIVVALLVSACASRSKQPPGLIDKRLAPCPGTPNCVSSVETREKASVAPLSFSGEPDNAWRIVVEEIETTGGRVEKHEQDYLWATFRSKVFRFVDDVELRLDRENRLIQIRSASRVGYYDLGVNRKRVESLREALTRRTTSP